MGEDKVHYIDQRWWIRRLDSGAVELGREDQTVKCFSRDEWEAMIEATKHAHNPVQPVPFSDMQGKLV